MSTNINISIPSLSGEDSGLLGVDKAIRQAVRTALQSKENIPKIEKKVESQNAQANGSGRNSGKPLQDPGAIKKKKPVALTAGSGATNETEDAEDGGSSDPIAARGNYGYLPPSWGYDYGGPGIYISPSTSIQFSTTGNFGVIKLAMPNECTEDYSPNQLFANRTSELVAFVQAGGVLWIQNEWLEADGTGCGMPPGPLNSYIQSNFGASIRFGTGDYFGFAPINAPAYGNCDAHTLIFSAPGLRAPTTFYSDYYSPIIGGTRLYGPSSLPVMSFEKIGRGYIVLSADSNAVAAEPVAIFSNQQYTIIDALQTLPF
jgi:hypothetical protein